LVNNIRKFKVWDSAILNDVLEKSVQIVYNIDTLTTTEEKDIMDYPPTTIPVHLLYNLCTCYNAMYDKLLEEGLVTSASKHKFTQEKFH